MSKVKIRAAFEQALKAFDTNMQTSWENVNFKPSSDVPFQEVFTMLAEPENPTMGDDFYRQRGYWQITLNYPQNTGPNAAETRADLLRKTFHRGLSLSAGGLTVTVEKTPEIGNGSIEGDRYILPVFIRFFANIFPTE